MNRHHRPVAPAVLSLLVFAALPDRGTAQDLTLGEAIASALASHPTVHAAAARLTAGEETAAGARAARWPGLSVAGALTRFQEPMVVAPLHSFDPTNPPSFAETLVQGQLTLDYSVFDGGARSASIRGSEAMAEAAYHRVAAAEMDVIGQAVSAYLTVLSSRAVLDAARAQVAALEEEHERVQRNIEAGTAAEVELLRAAASLQNARAGLASAEARAGLAERALARQTGVPANRIVARPLADVAVRSANELSGSRLSPLVESASRSVVAAEARLSEARAARLPRIAAAAGLNDFGDLGGEHVAEWQAGIRVSLPLFTGGGRRARIGQARAELEAARSDLSATELSIAQEVDAAETAVTEGDARAEALRSAIAQWEEVARIDRLALEAGSGVQRDLLEAEAGLFQARAGHAQARYDAILARVRLAKAHGTLDEAWIDRALEVIRQ
jgi:outer membrane protein